MESREKKMKAENDSRDFFSSTDNRNQQKQKPKTPRTRHELAVPSQNFFAKGSQHRHSAPRATESPRVRTSVYRTRQDGSLRRCPHAGRDRRGPDAEAQLQGPQGRRPRLRIQAKSQAGLAFSLSLFLSLSLSLFLLISLSIPLPLPLSPRF